MSETTSRFQSRHFHVTDPFHREWEVEFRWLQTGISIRHADTVDVKFELRSNGETLEKVIALPHPLLLELSRSSGIPLTDPWCMRLASTHLRIMMRTWEDMDKTLVTLSSADLERANDAVQKATAGARRSELSHTG
ncbi:MAG: hypothetical protein K2X03_20265 [Bryobacteraceae bacterium]|nr:hypothetical protein [Bryobacteraceae bacterium]